MSLSLVVSERRPSPISPNVARSHLAEYIWSPHNQSEALGAVNEARQVVEKETRERLMQKGKPQMPPLFRFFSDGFSNYRNGNLL